MRLYLESCRARTSVEIEESAYQERTRRSEILGFQDYVEALEIYSPIIGRTELPPKRWESGEASTSLPMKLPGEARSPRLFSRALAHLSGTPESPALIEELLFVCNKLLAADRVPPTQPARIKRTLRKVMCGINLGLDFWAQGNLARAVEGIRVHFLQSFFQIGYGQLLELQKQAQQFEKANIVEPGSFQEALIQGLKRRYPIMTLLAKGKVRQRFFQTRRDLHRIKIQVGPE
jgi:hypothetical protein